MSERAMLIVDEMDLSRRRFLKTVAASLGGMVLGSLAQARAGGGVTKPQMVTLGRVLMGTVVECEASHSDLSVAQQAVEAGLERMIEVDLLMSSFRPESEIGQINALAGRQALPVGSRTFLVLAEAQRIAEMSGGAFDVTTHPLTHLWRATTKTGRLPSRREMDMTLNLVGFDRLSLDPRTHSVYLRDPGMGIDLGGIAKGYAIDLAAQALARRGVRSGLVNGGGDLRVIGPTPQRGAWRIGLRHPLAPSTLLLSILAQDEGIATSGNYFNFFEVGRKQYGHLLHPRTGWPADAPLSATVIAKSTMWADGLATAAMIHGRDALAFIQRGAGVEGIIVRPLPQRLGRVLVEITPGLRGRIEPLHPSAVIES
jgi:thiamine biosynthesis lipoprotein